MRVPLPPALLCLLTIVVLALLPATGAAVPSRRPALSDLTVRMAAVHRIGIRAGSSASVRYIVRNRGRGQAPATTTSILWSTDARRDRSDRVIARHRTNALGGRRSRVIRRTIRVPTNARLGNSFLLVCADDLQRAREASERNNCTHVRVRITPIPERDDDAATAPDPVIAAPPSPVDATPSSGPGHASDISVVTRDGARLAYDLTWPTTGGAHPLIVVVHGGGWWRGSKDDAWVQAASARLVSAGFVVAAGTYRLACGTPSSPRRSDDGFDYALGSPLCGAYMPTQVADVVDVIRHARATAVQLGIGSDPRRVGVLGGSAGGHLALLAALEMSGDELGGVHAVANWSGPPASAYIEAQSDDAPSIRRSFTNAIGCTRAACPEAWSAMSPLEQLRPETATFAVLSLGGRTESQVPIGELAAFHRRLDELRVDNVHVVGSGACHGNGCADQPVPGVGRTGMELTIRFLDEQLVQRSGR
jgi:acetyl esterase/lipase